MITVIGPKDEVPQDHVLLNTTSRSKDWGRAFSPFLLGPVNLYAGYVSKNVENGWQYAKVYPKHAGAKEMLSDEYWRWAVHGWDNPRAVRYPMGKGAKPLFSTWNGFRLDYISARKYIYIPLYKQAVTQTDEFHWLKEVVKHQYNVALWDFDGYRHRDLGMSYEDVINDPNKTMGHAFVLAMLLEGDFDISYAPFWHFNYKQELPGRF